ncbi:MAG: hypothetical protein MJ095_06500 [Oscillospiraceae bacterium]|nr:hypothetical protein [Oscillospiraceae bacterium]
MNIKEKYMTDMNKEKLDSEFKENLIRAMQQKYESDEEDFSVDFDESVDFRDFEFTADSEPDIRPDIIHSEKRRSFTVFKYIASSAAVLALAASSILFFRDSLPDRNLTQEAEITDPGITEAAVTETSDSAAEITAVSSLSETAQSVTQLTTAAESSALSSQTVTDETQKKQNAETHPATAPAAASSGSQSQAGRETNPPVTTIQENTKKEYLEFYVERTEDMGDGYYDVYFGCKSTLTLSSFVFYPEYDSDIFEFVSAEKCIKDRYFTGNTTIDKKVVMFFDSALSNHEFNGTTLVRYTLKARNQVTDGSYKIGFTYDELAASANHVNRDGDGMIIPVSSADTVYTPGYINVTGSEQWKTEGEPESGDEEHIFVAKFAPPIYNDDGTISVYLDCDSDCTINEFLLNIIYDHQNLTLINSEIIADDKYRKNLFTDSSRIFFSSAESDSEAFTGGIIARFDFRPADNSEDESTEINIVMETNIFGTDNRDNSIVIPADKAVIGETKAELR